MELNEALKPCPFCGSKAELCEGEIIDKKPEGYWVACTNYPGCYCELGFVLIWTDCASGNFETPEEAIKAWNTRAE